MIVDGHSIIQRPYLLHSTWEHRPRSSACLAWFFQAVATRSCNIHPSTETQRKELKRIISSSSQTETSCHRQRTKCRRVFPVTHLEIFMGSNPLNKPFFPRQTKKTSPVSPSLPIAPPLPSSPEKSQPTPSGRSLTTCKFSNHRWDGILDPLENCFFVKKRCCFKMFQEDGDKNPPSRKWSSSTRKACG